MRPIHLVELDKVRPAVLLTRAVSRGSMKRITFAPITSRVRGLRVEVPVGPRNGLDQASVVNCDNIESVAVDRVGRLVGVLHDDQEWALAQALIYAFNLSIEELQY